MKRVGIVASREAPQEPIVEALRASLSPFETMLFSPSTHDGSLQDQVERFVSWCDSVVILVLSENPTAYYIAGYAAALKKHLIFVCDRKIQLPISLREFQYFIIGNPTKESILGLQLARIISPDAEMPKIHPRELAPSAPLPRKPAEPDESLPRAAKSAPQTEDEEMLLEEEMRISKMIRSMLEKNPHWTFQEQRDETPDRGFDFVLWNKNESAGGPTSLENPIALEIKATSRLQSPQITEVIRTAEKYNIRSLIIVTKTNMTQKSEQKYRKRARKRGITLIMFYSKDILSFSSQDRFSSLVTEKTLSM